VDTHTRTRARMLMPPHLTPVGLYEGLQLLHDLLVRQEALRAGSGNLVTSGRERWARHHEAEQFVEAAEPDSADTFVQLVEAADACEV
jgi:hypothetical protein